jgi:hypothetical protein
MSPLLTTRRALWWPGLAVLGAAVGVASLLGLWLGARSWPFEVAVIAAVLFCLRRGRRLRAQREEPAPPPSRPREKLRVIPGGKPDYDLAKDDSTDSQRWLM